MKTMNKMLQNRAYIGEYRHGDIVVEGGMPALVDEETFDKVQRKFAENKRKGSQRARGMDENDAPRYWLTGKVYCGKCGSTLQGVSGTSGTGRTYYYYYCSAQRRKQCTLKKVRKEKLEDAVTMILRSILHDSENLMSLAVDAAAYYEKNYRDTGYLDGLEAKRREVEKSLANLVKVIESGLISETVTERLVQLEEQKRALNEAIEAENIRAALCEDEHTIKAYFEKFLHADFDNPETRDQVLEYFVDKIYLTDDGLVVTSWYSEDRTEVTWDMLYGEDGNPFVKGEAVKFDCFPFGSTIASSTPCSGGVFSFSASFCLHWRGQFPIVVPAPLGGVAQLGERLTGSQEVRGSIPLVSTHVNAQPLVTGAVFISGLLAQRLAQGTHNPWVEGSNPPGPTSIF